jgi:hypothetical protein
MRGVIAVPDDRSCQRNFPRVSHSLAISESAVTEVPWIVGLSRLESRARYIPILKPKSIKLEV